MIEGTDGELPVVVDEVADSGSDEEGEAEVLALGVADSAAVGEAKADPRFDVGNPA